MHIFDGYHPWYQVRCNLLIEIYEIDNQNKSILYAKHSIKDVQIKSMKQNFQRAF